MHTEHLRTAGLLRPSRAFEDSAVSKEGNNAVVDSPVALSGAAQIIDSDEVTPGQSDRYGRRLKQAFLSAALRRVGLSGSTTKDTLLA